MAENITKNFIINDGNLLLFRKVKKQILGHSDIKDTMRYTHFAPYHLDDAITKIPIANYWVKVKLRIRVVTNA